MKVIDLLNKMANGERLPNKIKLDGEIWTCKEDKKYYKQCEIELIDWYGNALQRCLNDYIELIEDEVDIDNIEETEIKNDGMKYFEYENNGATESGYSKNYSAGDIETRIKINELVQAVKQLNKEIKELKSLDIEISEKDINEAVVKAIEERNKEIKSIKEK